MPDARRGPGRLRRVDGVVVAWKLGVIVEITPTPPARHRRDRRIEVTAKVSDAADARRGR